MIPKHISLRNFLSYREASLDFAGLHVACIAGSNGAGKSSLLEAIGWALWGQSRVVAEDDVIHQGAMEARVAFVFQQGEEVYRVIRSRHRLQGAGLEFQVKTETGYRVLTQRGLRATQRLICRALKLDYETFINSAYLRQGQGDDFMLKRPSDRKAMLATLLNLDRYDQVAEQAREQARQARAEVSLRNSQIEELRAKVADYQRVVDQQSHLQARLHQLEQEQKQAQLQLQQLRQGEQVYQHRQEQLRLYRQQQEHQSHLWQETQGAITEARAQLQRYEQILAQGAAITAGVQQLQALEADDRRLHGQFQEYQALQQQRQTLATTYDDRVRALTAEQHRLEAKRESLNAQGEGLARILEQAEAIQSACQQLRIAKARLKRLDDLQLQVGPLQQRRHQLQMELQHHQTRLQTRLEDLKATAAELHQQQAQTPAVQVSVQEVDQTLSYLEQRRAYQEQVRDKGLERRSFVATLQAKQRDCEVQMAEIEQKLKLLEQPEAACPLCDRPLDDTHRTLVEARHRLEHRDLQAQIWVMRDQLAASEREIQVLRQEYRAVEAELELYAPVLQRQGQLEAQMASQITVEQQLQRLEAEYKQLQHGLGDRTYSLELQTELQQIDQTLSQLAYDERDHALARGQVNRLRWADLKRHELVQAQRQHRHLQTQAQNLDDQLMALKQALMELEQSPLKQELATVQDKIQHLSYAVEHHQQVRQALQVAQGWHLKQQELAQAERQQPLLAEQMAALQTKAEHQQQTLDQLLQRIATLEAEVSEQGYSPEAIASLEAQIRDRQQQRETGLAQMGALTQACQHLEALQQQLEQHQQDLATVRQQQQVYQELAEAFGRKGIQAMMIENLLPQLEAETNQLLSRLSGHQLHVQFVTQRASKRRQSTLIDTLDILIADAQGTRPYETYSGGEAFRVNFALRLALARVLAQRSGVTLQLLIIDEGFGSQDEQGCDRLIAAINAIASDFACILAVTHIPHFRDAFQTRIDVSKGAEGSRLELAS